MTTKAEQLFGHVHGAIVRSGTGTTHATANTTNPFNHGLVDAAGAAIDPTKYRAFAISNNNNEGAPYIGSGGLTATQLDVMSVGTAVPFWWFIVHVGDIDNG